MPKELGFESPLRHCFFALSFFFFFLYWRIASILCPFCTPKQRTTDETVILEVENLRIYIDTYICYVSNIVKRINASREKRTCIYLLCCD